MRPDSREIPTFWRHFTNSGLQPGVNARSLLQTVSTVCADWKPLKRFSKFATSFTGLKPGVSETRLQTTDGSTIRFAHTVPFLLVAIVALAGCSKPDEAPAGSENETGQVSRVRHGTNGEIIVTLDADTQKTMELQTSKLSATTLRPEVTGYGRVVDPSMLSAAVADFVSAGATATASQKELDRLKTLASQDNASARAVEAAEAAANRDAAQADAAHARLLAATGRTIADRTDLPSFVKSLASGEFALVQIDLPPDDAPQDGPTRARIVPLTDSRHSAEGRFLGQAGTVDPLTQNQGFLFVVENNSARLAPGMAVTGYLSISGGPRPGVIVPRAAVIRHAGEPWVYLKTDGTNFIRRAISLATPLADGWFVETGVAAGDEIVVGGAQSVFSEELNGSGLMGGERD